MEHFRIKIKPFNLPEMISVYYRIGEEVHFAQGVDALKSIPMADIFWVDLMDVERTEELQIEQHFGVEIINNKESLEIEHSARFIEYKDHLVTRTEFISRKEQEFYHSTVSFTILKNTLITNRNYPYKSFQETERKVMSGNGIRQSADVFLSIMDHRIANDADIVEELTKDISAMSEEVITGYRSRKNMILKINRLREHLMLLMQNGIDKKLMISYLKKTSYYNQRFDYEVDISIKDLESVIDYIRFNIDRLDYLDRTLNNLITFDQNNSIKLFTIVSLFFMPPMLIASIYGMNFKFMPELGHEMGYFFALALMLLSVLFTAVYFKRKKWL